MEEKKSEKDTKMRQRKEKKRVSNEVNYIFNILGECVTSQDSICEAYVECYYLLYPVLGTLYHR